MYKGTTHYVVVVSSASAGAATQLSLAVLRAWTVLQSPCNETQTATLSSSARIKKKFYLGVIYVQHSIFISHLLSKIITQ